MARRVGFPVLVLVAASRVYLCKGYISHCPPGWLEFRNHCYKSWPPDKQKLTFNDAEAYCQGFSNQNGVGHLVSVHDQQENTFVNHLATASGSDEYLFIGLTDEEFEGKILYSNNALNL